MNGDISFKEYRDLKVVKERHNNTKRAVDLGLMKQRKGKVNTAYMLITDIPKST